jgi:mRNA interferase HigB
MRCGTWGNLAELRRTLPAADPVKVASGRRVIVFNIGGNAFRLIAALHFNTGHAYALAFMTHAEYSKDRWRNTL